MRVISREIRFIIMRLENVQTGMSINKEIKSPRTKLSCTPTDKSETDEEKPTKEEKP